VRRFASRLALIAIAALAIAVPPAAASPAQLARLVATGGADYDAFGASVAISESTIVVGAEYADAGGTLRGAAYVFEVADDGTVRQVARLVPSDPLDHDYFGTSVAIDGDAIVVGAPGERPQSSFPSSGKRAAYVFAKPAGGWRDATETAKLTATGAGVADLTVGHAVAVSGATVVVAAYDGGIGSNPGRALVYERPAGGWVDATPTATLSMTGVAPGEFAAGDVAVDGDTVVVGAQATPGPTYRGAAFVFTRPAGGWVDVTGGAALTASDPLDDRSLGVAVAVDGDTIVVGAPGSNSFAVVPGAAYVYVRPAGGWAAATETAKLTVPDAGADERVGGSVAISGGRIAVGTFGFGQRTVAWTYERPAGGWISAAPSAVLAASDVVAGDGFGYPVALDGQLVVVGARQADAGGVDRGAAYVFTTRALAPTGLSAASACATRVAFAAGADGGSAITGYERSIDGGAWSAVAPAASGSPLWVAGLPRGSSSSVRLRAVTAQGAGYPSAALDVAMPGRAACLRVRSARVLASGVVVVRAEAGAAGRLSIAGSRLGRASGTTCSATRTAAAAGTVVLRCPPNAATRARLALGPLRASISVTLTPSVGRAATASRVVLLPGTAGPEPVTG
jgi:hypothetical protein